MNIKRENAIYKLLRYIKHHGIKQTLRKIQNKITKSEQAEYEKWRRHVTATAKELEEQQRHVFPVAPLVSLVIPLYQTQPEFLEQLIHSVKQQTYSKWEICFADGSKDDRLSAVAAADQSGRIRYQFLNGNKGIAGNTNEALEMAKGDIIALMDHDDLLEPDALYEIVKAANENPTADMFYTDEDKIDLENRHYFEPSFKSDFNLDLLRSMNYICHLLAVRNEVIKQLGGFRSEFEGAQDYDLILRCVEVCLHDNRMIYHIPKALYHWRCHQESTAQNPESKAYAFEAGQRAIQAHLDRLGIKGTVEQGQRYGLYHVRYQYEEEPLISVIIPNKDHASDLKLCMDSIIQKSTYRNYEFIIVENNSKEPGTFEFYREIEEKDKAKVVRWEGSFNFSAIINFGAAHASGEYLLFLNNDTEIIKEDCLKEMVTYCMRPEVGIVGAKLLYGDDTIQHAGVVIGFGGIAGHTFIGLHKDDISYGHRAIVAQDYSAVTAACMMTKKSIFHKVGGFDENLQVAFNDIDYCMKVRAAGYLVVYNPYAELYHYESKSRGYEDTPEKVARFNSEIDKFAKKWPEILKKGDPYYNINLTMNKSNFALRDLIDEPR